jgi:hypothetical protein
VSQVQLEAFFLVQNACTAFPSTLVSMLELSPPLSILPLLRVAGLSGLNTIIVGIIVWEKDIAFFRHPPARTQRIITTMRKFNAINILKCKMKLTLSL